jgi:hypothetical protein
MAFTVTVEVPPDREVLRSWARSTSIPAGLARRTRILLAADGAGTIETGWAGWRTAAEAGSAQAHR